MALTGLVRITAAIRSPEALHVLKIPVFRRLFLGSVFEDIAMNVRSATVSWLVLDLTGSALWVGLATGVRVVPNFLFGALGGVLSDLFPRRTIIVASQATLAIIAAAAATLVLLSDVAPWHLLAISAASAAVGGVLVPAGWALIGDAVPSQRLSGANALLGMTVSSGEMLGPAVAGALIASNGAGAAFALAAGGYLASAGLLMRLPRDGARRGAATVGSIFRDLRAGAAFIARTQPLPWLIPLLAVTNILGVAIFPMIPVYARDVLKVGPAGFGLLSASMGLGFLTAAVSISVFGNFRRKAAVILLGGLVWDSCMIGFGFSRFFPLSMALLFLMGLSGQFWLNAVVTIFQSAASPEMRGRVMSVLVMANAMFPLGWLYGGALAEAVGNERALIISAAGETPVMLLGFALSRSLRRV